MRLGAAALAAFLLAPFALAQPSDGADDEGAPLAFFTLSPPTVGTGSAARVDASESRPSEGATNITEYAWSFEGEPHAPGDRIASHVFNDSGVFVVSLRVTDDAGRVAFANQTLLVKGLKPNAYFDLRQAELEGGIEVVVNATFSEPSRGARRIVKYEWDWGEGDGFQEGNVTETHHFVEAGNYTIRLRVTDDSGRTDEVNEPVLVRSTFLTRMLQVWGEREAFLRGARLTVGLAIVTTVVGFLVAIVLALMRISRLAILRWPAAVYIEFIRGTPLLVQILIAWLVLPFMGLKLPILWAGGLALIVNTSAYQAEAIRAGIQAIPTGQMEAAMGLGMSYLQAMRHVILPQAFRLTIPALGNEFIILLKDTSLVSVIGVVELTQVAKILSARTFLVLEVWLGVAFVYFVMTYVLSQGLRYLERRLAIPGMGLQGVSH